MNKRLVELRKSLRLNQGEFAEKLGFTSSNLSYIEAGKTPLTESNIRLICLTFGVNEGWLREGKGEMLDDEASLTEYERRLLELFRRLSAKARKMLIEYAEKLVSDEAALRGEALTAEKGEKAG